LIVAIEKLVNNDTDFKDQKEIAKTQKHNKQQMEMDGAGNLRQACIVNLKCNKESNVSDLEEASSNGGSSKKPARNMSNYSVLPIWLNSITNVRFFVKTIGKKS
jgi:hypothetical protein